MAKTESEPQPAPDSVTSDLGPDLTAAPVPVAQIPAEILAASFGEYARGLFARVRSGNSGVLPVIAGLILITIVFQAVSPHHVFLSAGNVVNLFQQSAVFMVLGMAEIFALLLGEIDLSIGYLGVLGAAVSVQLVQPATTNWPWWIAILAGLLVGAALGWLQGTLVARLKLPSFIVTLAGQLMFFGALLIVLGLGPFSGYPSLTGQGDNPAGLYRLMWGNLDPTVSWLALAVVVGIMACVFWRRDGTRRRSGLVAPPVSVTLIKIVSIALAGVVVVFICNINRANLGTVAGVPFVIPIVLAVLLAWTILLQRTRYGRYVYAIGGNAEAARRAGINLARIRTWAFVLAGVTAVVAGLLYASYLGGLSNNVNGGQLVLYAVAAAVIGGTSLFGGRGKAMHAVLGGLVIGGIYNGMYLLGLHVEWQYIVTGLVLLVAVTIDALSRRSSGTVARV